MRNGFGIGAAGCVVAFLVAGCSEAPEMVAAAAATDPAPSASGSLREPPVTAQEAQATALDEVGGGWILETTIEERDDDPDEDRDDYDGDDDFEAPVDVWEVTVVSPDGLRRTVSVDLTGGKVLDTRVDD